MAVQPILVLAGIFSGTIITVSTMGFVLRYLAQRRMARLATSSDEIAQRLERLEQGMDAIAMQVERLGETNRFVAKLLAEKTDVLPRRGSGDPPNAP